VITGWPGVIDGVRPDGPEYGHQVRIEQPSDIVATVDGMYASDLIAAVVTEFDLFTWLDGRESASTAEITAHFQLNERAVDVTITYLVAAGLLDRLDDGSVVPSGIARSHLVAGSEDLRLYFGMAHERPGCLELIDVLRTGDPAPFGSATRGQQWLARMATAPFANQFSAGMDARGRFLAPHAAQALGGVGYRRVLDIGGSTGTYSCALVEAAPGSAATVLELPAVAELSRKLVLERGFADRVQVRVGDMFEPLPAGYDLHFYSHVLHDWDAASIERLAANSFAALPPGGWLVDHDVHINDTKTGPLAAAVFSIWMMHVTRGKCWSRPELARIFTGVGFTDVEDRPTTAGCSAILARKPF
jgi:predicted O-methyltransferase YrrM